MKYTTVKTKKSLYAELSMAIDSKVGVNVKIPRDILRKDLHIFDLLKVKIQTFKLEDELP